ncbi:MAG TPA: TadE/TadG family type IV pilus assembly protein [Gemmatimonadaceae bacterium]|nr:TadE/TadG family type IV pilus assembly protein [Gemmatimonadaceae bacterium]
MTILRSDPKRARVGTAIIELAVALPVLLLIVLGAADFGRMFFTGITVANAARATAEYATLTVENSGKDTAILNQIGRDDAGDVADVVVTSERFCRCPNGTTPACDGTCPGTPSAPEIFVKAKAQKTINLILRYPGLRSTMTFRDSATFRAQ